jgi:hypothetical protein
MLAAQSGARWPAPASLRLRAIAVCGALTLAFCLPAAAQQTPPEQQAPPAQPGTTPPAASQQTAPDAAQNPTQLPTSTAATPAAAEPLPPEVTEDELRRMLVGKQLFLRGGYMDNDLNFNESGNLIGHSPQGSFTLSEVQIERVRLTKHKAELEGTRYGLHFLGALAYEDNSTAFEPLRITPKKKVLKITIDREQVLVRKTKKETITKEKGQKSAPATPASASPTAAQPATSSASAAPSQTPPAATEPSDADQIKAQIAAAPAAERPADPASVTATDSPLHAANLLRGAVDRIFSVGIDDRLKAAMPDCWKLYYQAVADKADYSPKDPAVLRQNAVDKKAKLLSVFQPDSNEYAQADAVSGMALYHTVIGPDGKPQEIAVARPIGFGLDENAVASIRKASFEPAIKDGKPVPVLLDLVVEFHIYSKRTAAVSNPQDASKPAEPSLPGPYSLQQP